jgi:hypothetical protein
VIFLVKVMQVEIAKKAFWIKVGVTNGHGAMLGKAQAQRIEDLNSAASRIYHKKDCLCQEEK